MLSTLRFFHRLQLPKTFYRGITHVDEHLYISKKKAPDKDEDITFRDCTFAIVVPVAHLSIKI